MAGLKDSIFEVVITAFLAVTFGMSSWVLITLVDIESNQAVQQHRLAQVEQDKTVDVSQNTQLSKHWKLHSWARDEINTLRAKQGLDIKPWPDL